MTETILDKIQSIIDDLNVFDKEYRKRDEDAWEISDLEEAKRVRDETFIVIRKIKQFKITLMTLSEDITNSGITLKEINLNDDCLVDIKINDIITDNDNEDANLDYLIEEKIEKCSDNSLIKIGEYIKQFFDKISNEKLILDSDMIENMQDKVWTNQTLKNLTSLIKKYDSTKTLDEQIKVCGYTRYWKDLFYINEIPYLVTCCWKEHQRKAFDTWKDSVVFVEDINVDDTSNYLDKDEKITNLEMQDEFSYTMVDKIIFCNKEYYPRNWADTLVTVVNLLISHNNLDATDLLEKKALAGKTQPYFSLKLSSLRKPYKLSNGCYMETNFSAKDIYKLSYRIIKEFGYDQESLRIFYSKKEYYKNKVVQLEDSNAVENIESMESHVSNGSKYDNDVISSYGTGTSSRTSSLFLFDKEYTVNSYGDALFKVCELLVYKNPYDIAMLPYKNIFAQYFSSKESNLSLPQKLKNGIYVETELDKEQTISLIEKILDLCKYNSSEVNFSISDKE